MQKKTSYSDYYNLYGNEYYTRRIENGGLLFNEVIEIPAVLKLIDEQSIATHGQMLDIGCAFGFYSKLFASKGLNVTAIDVSEKMISLAIDYCQGYSNINFINANFIEYNLNDDFFDIAIGCFMLGYFDNLNLFFQKIKSTTKSKSSIIVSMLHPIVQHKVEKTSEGYIINDYFVSGKFESNFLSQAQTISLNKWGYPDVFLACKSNGLYVENIVEPKPLIKGNLTSEQFDFYNRLPSISIFLIKHL